MPVDSSGELTARTSLWADARRPGRALVSVQRADAPDLVTGHRAWGVLVDRDKVMTPGPGDWLTDARVRHEILVFSLKRDEKFFLVERLGIQTAEIAGDPPGSPGSVVALLLDRDSRHRPFSPASAAGAAGSAGTAGSTATLSIGTPAVGARGSSGDAEDDADPSGARSRGFTSAGPAAGAEDLWGGLVERGLLPDGIPDHDPQEVLGWVERWEQRRRESMVHTSTFSTVPRYMKFHCCSFILCRPC